jgi:hypothetical protein
MSGNKKPKKRDQVGALLSEDGRGRHLSEQKMKLTETGALTNWRQQIERLVRKRKESDRVRGTHQLETAEGLVKTWKETA